MVSYGDEEFSRSLWLFVSLLVLELYFSYCLEDAGLTFGFCVMFIEWLCLVLWCSIICNCKPDV